MPYYLHVIARSWFYLLCVVPIKDRLFRDYRTWKREGKWYSERLKIHGGMGGLGNL